jgi:hypothetical protein
MPGGQYSARVLDQDEADHRPGRDGSSWREAGVRRSGEVGKVSLLDSCSAAFNVRCAIRRLRSLAEPGDGVTVISRVDAFGGAIQDLAKAIPCSLPIIDSHES